MTASHLHVEEFFQSKDFLTDLEIAILQGLLFP